MGGHNAGQIASEAALKIIVRAYFADFPTQRDVAGALQAAFQSANELICAAASRFPNRAGMGTTATVAVVRDQTLTIAHVGDSRAYLLRDGRLRQLTDDHSWVEEQVRRGGMSRQAALQSPYRNVITRSIGMGAELEADIVEERLAPGDLILLCTDGLTGYLDGPALAERLDAGSPAAAALALVDAANDAGGRDNITALLLAVRDIDPFEDDHVAG
jgi:serine/threonine protein phosphatase PrpC